MTLLTQDELADFQVRASQAGALYEAMEAGLLTVENITTDDRFTIRDALMNSVTASGHGTDLVEGRDWCFATSANGHFGIYALLPELLYCLNGATLHLWHDNTLSENNNPELTNYPFGMLRDYQQDAQEVALSMSPNELSNYDRG